MVKERKEITNLRAAFFRALADPLRQDILEYLRDGERCVCEIFPEFEKAQSTMSKHLAILHDTGILKRRIDGVRTIYSIKRPEIFQITKQANEFIIKELKETKRRIEAMEASQ